MISYLYVYMNDPLTRDTQRTTIYWKLHMNLADLGQATKANSCSIYVQIETVRIFSKLKNFIYVPCYKIKIGQNITTCIVPNTASYIRGWIQMVLTPNDLFSWNNKYSKYTNIYIANTFTFIF